MSKPLIDRPIFVIGCPRSGTKVPYHRLTANPQLAWVSNVTKKTPDSLLLTRLLMIFRKDHHPTEAHNIWNRYATADHDARGRDDATPRARRFLHKVVRNHMRLWNKPRFINKCPRNSLRIPYLHAVFPDAHFIHIIRDGRAVANSLRKSRINHHQGKYWACQPPGWREIAARPILESCAMQWQRIVTLALADAAQLPAAQYTEVRYEELCAKPLEVMGHLSERAGLRWEPGVLEQLVSDIESRNHKWRETFSQEEIATVNAVQGELLTRLGYEL